MYHLRLHGNHYDMGRKMGLIFRKNKTVFPIMLDEFQKKFGAESGHLLKKYFPEAAEEIRGIAKDKKHAGGVEYAGHVLAGKNGFMCQYPSSLGFTTVWSSIFDISGEKVYLAEGSPARSVYKTDKRPLFDRKKYV